MEPKGEAGVLTWCGEKSVATKKGRGFGMGQYRFSKASKQWKQWQDLDRLIQWIQGKSQVIRVS